MRPTPWPGLFKGPRVLEQECSPGHVNPDYKPRRLPIQVHRREPDPVWEGMGCKWNIIGTMSRVIFGVGNLICGGVERQRPPSPFGHFPNRVGEGRGGVTSLNYLGRFKRQILPQLVGEVPEGRWGAYVARKIPTSNVILGTS
jgi:hypothetical protein